MIGVYAARSARLPFPASRPFPTPCRRRRRPALVAGLLLLGLLVPLGGGCQAKTKVRERRMMETILSIDFTGLKPAETIEPLHVSVSAPKTWEAMPLVKTPLYSHQQWRSPSRLTGMGIVHARLPLPLGRKMVIWLAKKEYTKRANDGRVIAEWDDDVGRTWFEAENNKYHVRGYVQVEGFAVWFVYYGHKTATAPDPAEISLAARSVETIVPDTFKLPFPVKVPEVATPRDGSADPSANEDDEDSREDETAHSG